MGRLRDRLSRFINFETMIVTTLILANIATLIWLVTAYIPTEKSRETAATQPTSRIASPDSSESPAAFKTIDIPPSFGTEESHNRVDTCDQIRAGEAVNFIVKGKADPPLPDGGVVVVDMKLDAGIELTFQDPPRPDTYTGRDQTMMFEIPAHQTQQVIMLLRNTGNVKTSACFGLAYEYPSEAEPVPEFKDENDPPLLLVPNGSATPYPTGVEAIPADHQSQDWWDTRSENTPEDP